MDKENDATLLQAYQASYAALQNIPFNEFKERAKLGSGVHVSQTVEEIHNKVEHFIDDYQWEEV